MKGKIIYSNNIRGNKRNHRLDVRFDKMDGYIGISQFDGEKIDRVLLTPFQFRELVKFVEEKK